MVAQAKSKAVLARKAFIEKGKNYVLLVLNLSCNEQPAVA
jgi:hypothetical protein